MNPDSHVSVVYAAPNRSHHYPYAEALYRQGMLRAFVSGYPRLSPRSDIEIPRDLLIRCDAWQTAYLGSMRLRLPGSLVAAINLRSKRALDDRAGRILNPGDLFLFYNGCGCDTVRRRNEEIVSVCEVVNSHVTTQHDLLREEHRRLGLPFAEPPKRELARRLEEYERSDFLLGPSRFVLDSFRERGFPDDRLLQNPYGLPATVRERAADGAEWSGGPAAERFRVLYVGQITPRKGLCYLIDAFSRLGHPNSELVIVGARCDPSGIERAAIPANVTFRGVLHGRELERAYREASVFVQPSIEEGLSLVVGEALAHGLPVIATGNSGAAELVEHGPGTWIVPIRDPAAIAECLRECADASWDEQCVWRRRNRALAAGLGGWQVSGDRLAETLLRAGRGGLREGGMNR